MEEFRRSLEEKEQLLQQSQLRLTTVSQQPRKEREDELDPMQKTSVEPQQKPNENSEI